MTKLEQAAEQFADDLSPGPGAENLWYARKAAYLAGASWQLELDAKIADALYLWIHSPWEYSGNVQHAIREQSRPNALRPDEAGDT